MNIYVDYIVWPHLCMKHRWVWGFSGFGVKRCVPGVTLSTTECFGDDPEARWLFHKGARCVHWYMVNSWWCFTRIQLYDNIYTYIYIRVYVCVYIYIWQMMVNDGYWLMMVGESWSFARLVNSHPWQGFPRCTSHFTTIHHCTLWYPKWRPFRSQFK